MVTDLDGREIGDLVITPRTEKQSRYRRCGTTPCAYADLAASFGDELDRANNFMAALAKMSFIQFFGMNEACLSMSSARTRDGSVGPIKYSLRRFIIRCST